MIDGSKFGRQELFEGVATQITKQIGLPRCSPVSCYQRDSHYKNKTKVEVVPDFLVRLYNPFGVCMGGVHVSGDNMYTPAPVAPGNKGVSQHRFGIFQMEAYIRHGLKDKLPADFANLAWVSIARSNTVLVEKPPKKKRVLRFELLNKE